MKWPLVNIVASGNYSKTILLHVKKIIPGVFMILVYNGNITMLLIEQFLGNDENDYQRFVNACSVNRSTLEELMNVGCVSISGGGEKTRTIAFYQR